MEPKSQPAGPACCLADCKLSLRMQTDKQDRHHWPILPSETILHRASSHCIFFFYLSLHFLGIFFPSTHMHVYELPNLFPLSSSSRSSSATICLSLLFSIDETSPFAADSPLSLSSGLLPRHRRRRAFGLFLLFYQLINPLQQDNELSIKPQDTIRLLERNMVSINIFQLPLSSHPLYCHVARPQTQPH